MKKEMNYKNQMNVLMDGIRKSYADWNGNPVDSKDEVRLNMIERFNSTIRIDNGRKFDKIVTGTSVWGFVAKDDGMFKNMPMKKVMCSNPLVGELPLNIKEELSLLTI